jgi:hypothetical protein
VNHLCSSQYIPIGISVLKDLANLLASRHDLICQEEALYHPVPSVGLVDGREKGSYDLL